MYAEQNIIAVIPARGGSKGLPRKNILPLGNKPLIAWSIDAARASAYIDEIVLSTDDTEIAEIAETCGVNTVLRPPEFATDQALIEVADRLYQRGDIELPEARSGVIIKNARRALGGEDAESLARTRNLLQLLLA